MKGQHPTSPLPLRSRRPAAEVAQHCARFAAECRSRGVRLTPQRIAVFRVVVEDLSHPTAEAVHRRILGDLEAMSLGTVYRTLDFLVGAGLLRRVSTPESIARFDANCAPHQHLICRSCGLMRDWEETELRGLRLPRATVPGFQAESLDIRIVGLCAACARRNESPQHRQSRTRTTTRARR